MLRKPKNNKQKILSDKITDILTVQSTADIEDDHYFGSKPKILTKNDVDSSDSDDAALSDFRKRNVNLLSDISKKYEGEVSNPKLDEDTFDSDDEVLNGTIESDDDLYGEDDVMGKQKDGQSDDLDFTVESDEDSASNEFEVESEEGIDLSQLDSNKDDNFVHMKEENISEELNKGNCVRNQLLIWENLLELRINMQKCLIIANKMPMTETFKKLKHEGGEEFCKKTTETENSLKQLLDKLLSLQETQLRNFPETKNLNETDQEKKDPGNDEIEDPLNEEIPSDSESNDGDERPQEWLTPKPPLKRKLAEYSEEISKRHNRYKSYRDSVIQKWNDKTQLAVVNSKSALSNPILSQINYILADKKRLIRRTQLKRSDYKIIGYEKSCKGVNDSDALTTKDKKDDDEYIANIFDDDDFYHQLLRELIECKTADVSDPIELGRRWVALQQLKSKMKRKVDTKATKGRRIKYVVHPKLVNFMAPEKNFKWPDESKTELYKSLFGKVFEQNLLNPLTETDENSIKIMTN